MFSLKTHARKNIKIVAIGAAAASAAAFASACAPQLIF